MPATLDFCVVATDVVDRRAGAAFRNALTSRSYIFTHSSETLLLNPNAPQMFDDKGNGLFSTVLLDWIEWEGPLETDAEKSRRKGLVPPDDATPEVVAEHLQRFAERAWRRPVKQGGAGRVSAILPRRTRGGRKDGRRLSRGAAGRADLPKLPLPRRGRPGGPRTSQRLGTRLAALVFPLEFDAGRRPLRRGQRRRPERRGTEEGGGPDVGGQPDQPLHRRLLAAVAATAPRRHVPAGQEALPHLRRVARDEHARRAGGVFPRDVREEPARSMASSIPTGPWPMPGSAISTGCRSRRRTASSASRSSPRIIAAVC